MYQSPFKEKEYKSADRPKITDLIIEKYVQYISRLNPNDDIENIREFVKKEILSTIKIPNIDMKIQVKPGNFERKIIPLDTYVSKIIKNNIVSPSGSVFRLPEDKESFLRVTINGKKKERSKYKKLMLEYKEKGDVLQENIANYLQSSAKITNNSFAGAFNSTHNFLYSKSNFQSITAFTRESAKCGYTQIELFLGANLYLPTVDSMITYILRVLEVSNLEEAQKVITKYDLKTPTVEHVKNMFLKCLYKYNFTIDLNQVNDIISSLSDIERSVIFYTGCLWNLLNLNETYFRSFFKKMFSTENISPYEGNDLKEKLKQDSDIRMMCLSINYQILGKDKDGKNLTLEESITENEMGYRTFIGIEDHLVNCLEEIKDIIEVFLKPDITFGKLQESQRMVRTNTPISDTDSALFSTQNIVEWYTGKASFSKDAFAINAFTVFCVVKSLEHKFARLSSNFGMSGKDIYEISMKNEYFMAGLIRSSEMKTYISLLVFQEGKVLPKPKLDIKGRLFRDSVISPLSNEKVRIMADMLLKEVLEHEKVDIHKYLSFVIDFESQIIRSLQNGEKTFFKLESIKEAHEYAGDANSTSYFYAYLWNEVFGERYEPIVLPNKCYVLPLIDGGKRIWENDKWFTLVKEKEPKVYPKLLAFKGIAKGLEKEITRLCIPASIPEIPDILRPIISIRKVVYANCSPLYRILSCMGIDYTYKNQDNTEFSLISDLFGNSPLLT